MRLLKLKNAAKENRPVYVNPNRIVSIEPVSTDRSVIRTQDGAELDISSSAEELERRFEEITQPGKQKVLRALSRHVRENRGTIEFTVTPQTDPVDYETLHRFIEEQR